MGKQKVMIYKVVDSSCILSTLLSRRTCCKLHAEIWTSKCSELCNPVTDVFIRSARNIFGGNQKGPDRASSHCRRGGGQEERTEFLEGRLSLHRSAFVHPALQRQQQRGRHSLVIAAARHGLGGRILSPPFPPHRSAPATPLTPDYCAVTTTLLLHRRFPAIVTAARPAHTVLLGCYFIGEEEKKTVRAALAWH